MLDAPGLEVAEPDEVGVAEVELAELDLAELDLAGLPAGSVSEAG